MNVKPESADDRFYLATLYQIAGQRKEAAQQYRTVIARQPDHALALNNLAVILSEEDKMAEAESLAQRAADLVPENASVLDTYGWILLRRGRNLQALQVLEKAAARSADNPVILYHLGAAYKENRNDNAARVNLRRALSLSSDFEGAEQARKLLDSL